MVWKAPHGAPASQSQIDPGEIRLASFHRLEWRVFALSQTQGVCDGPASPNRDRSQRKARIVPLPQWSVRCASTPIPALLRFISKLQPRT